MLYISADLGSHKNIVQAKWIVNSKSLRKPDLEGLCCTCVYMQSSIYSRIDKIKISVNSDKHWECVVP